MLCIVDLRSNNEFLSKLLLCSKIILYLNSLYYDTSKELTTWFV